MEKYPVIELQRKFFENRYVGASLSQGRWPAEINSKAMGWIENFNGMLVLVGPPGCGKTYFCSAILEFIPTKCRSFRFYNERQLMQRVRSSIGEYEHGDYLATVRSLMDDDFIIIDDLGVSTREEKSKNEWREEVIMEAIDYRYSTKKPTLITTNLSRPEWDKYYNSRLSSRLFSKENMVVDLSGCPDLRTQGI